MPEIIVGFNNLNKAVESRNGCCECNETINVERRVDKGFDYSKLRRVVLVVVGRLMVSKVTRVIKSEVVIRNDIQLRNGVLLYGGESADADMSERTFCLQPAGDPLCERQL